jgi:hypothetical protein
MNEASIGKLLNLIAEIVRENGPWKEKAKAILDEATNSDKINLQEFCTWFDEEDEEVT